jgi:hypothetical protein
MTFFLKRANKLLPYIDIGGENMVMAEAKQKKRKTRGENYPPGNKLTQPCSN